MATSSSKHFSALVAPWPLFPATLAPIFAAPEVFIATDTTGMILCPSALVGHKYKHNAMIREKRAKFVLLLRYIGLPSLQMTET